MFSLGSATETSFWRSPFLKSDSLSSRKKIQLHSELAPAYCMGTPIRMSAIVLFNQHRIRDRQKRDQLAEAFRRADKVCFVNFSHRFHRFFALSAFVNYIWQNSFLILCKENLNFQKSPGNNNFHSMKLF